MALNFEIRSNNEEGVVTLNDEVLSRFEYTKAPRQCDLHGMLLAIAADCYIKGQESMTPKQKEEE